MHTSRTRIRIQDESPSQYPTEFLRTSFKVAKGANREGHRTVP